MTEREKQCRRVVENAGHEVLTSYDDGRIAYACSLESAGKMKLDKPNRRLVSENGWLVMQYYSPGSHFPNGELVNPGGNGSVHIED